MVNTQLINMPGTTYHAVASGAVSAGDLLASASTTNVMTAISQAGYEAGTVLVAVATTSDDAIIVGVALTDAASGETLSVATQGLFIFAGDAANVSTTGKLVEQGATAQTVKDAASYSNVIGRAVTGSTAAASKYLLVRLNI